jgi:MFS family permease
MRVPQFSLPQARLSVSAIFLIHGVIVASWASRIPDFQAMLHLSPAILGRSLMIAATGSVLAMPLTGWLVHALGSRRTVIATSLGFSLTLPVIAETHSVIGLSGALLFYGAMAGSMDVAMNTHAVLLERQYKRHIMSSFHALFSVGGMAGSVLGGVVVSHGITTTIHFRISGFVLAVLSLAAFLWLRFPEPMAEAHPVGSKARIKFSFRLGALALLAFSSMLVEGAMADWSAIYLRFSVFTGGGLAALGYAVFSGAMAVGRFTGDFLTETLGRAHLVRCGTLLACAGLAVALLFGNIGSALAGFACVGAGLATVIPSTFAASGNIDGCAPGPALAAVATAGYLGFLTGPPLIGLAAQFSGVRSALWILVVLSAVSALAAGSMNRTSTS